MPSLIELVECFGLGWPDQVSDQFLEPAREQIADIELVAEGDYAVGLLYWTRDSGTLFLRCQSLVCAEASVKDGLYATLIAQ